MNILVSNNINLYHYENNVSVLGPGNRYVLWFQGCPFGCNGCLVPETHDENRKNMFDIDDICCDILSQDSIDGITFTGGEPFIQIKQMAKIIENIKRTKDLSIMIYSGYTLEALKSIASADVDYILSQCDILVDGKFQQALHYNEPWRGSQNQQIHFLTLRYGIKDYMNASKYSLQYHINTNGGVFQSGIPCKEYSI